ncbi:MAG: transporter [Cyclobacteriaceae bacterium]
MLRALLIATLFVFGTSVPVWSQCCSGGVPLSGNLGLPPSNKGAFQFSLSYDLNVLRTFKTGTEKLDERDRQRVTHAALVEVGYSFSDKFGLDGFFSFVRQERKIENPGLPTDFQHTEGIGDAVLLLKYTLASTNTRTWVVGVGPKIPTGASDLKDNGILLSADLQPGSGSWDGVAWSNLSQQIKARPSMTFVGTITYRLSGTNPDFRINQDYRFGNEFQAIAGLSDQLVIGKLLVDPSVSLRYRRAGVDKADKAEVPNTGGEWVFINPNLGFRISERLSYNISGELPLYANITGTQLTPTFRFNTGFYYIVSRKKSGPLDLQPLNTK